MFCFHIHNNDDSDFTTQARSEQSHTTKAAVSLHTAFEKYSTDPNLLKQQSLNARNMAEALFDREKTYAELAAFILANDSADTQ